MVKKLVVAVTGASGTIYAREFFRHIPYDDWEVHAVVSTSARLVAEHEGGLNLPPRVREWDERDFTAPFASGSARFECMAVVPCSTSTLGKLANGIADNLITRAGEVFLKERRRLVVVPRETPLSLVQIRNMKHLAEAGAVVLPASPTFYGNPRTVEELADTVVARIFDHLGVRAEITHRWREGERQSPPHRSRDGGGKV